MNGTPDRRYGLRDVWVGAFSTAAKAAKAMPAFASGEANAAV